MALQIRKPLEPERTIVSFFRESEELERKKYLEKTESCRKYYKHKEKYSDYNVLGQVYRIECQLSKTDFENSKDIEQLKWVVKDSARILEKIY